MIMPIATHCGSLCLLIACKEYTRLLASDFYCAWRISIPLGKAHCLDWNAFLCIQCSKLKSIDINQLHMTKNRILNDILTIGRLIRMTFAWGDVF